VPINWRWLGWLLAVFGAAIVYATLGPEDWQVRLGLHWLVEHFLAFFTLTALACLIWPRLMLIVAMLVPVAVGLEVAQGLTKDRTPDVGTALMAAAAVALAALLVDLVLSLRQKRRKV
jgi:hypothetical protein